jgi:hypothetical protein
MAKAPNREGRTRHLKEDGSTAELDEARQDGQLFHYTVFKELMSGNGTQQGAIARVLRARVLRRIQFLRFLAEQIAKIR